MDLLVRTATEFGKVIEQLSDKVRYSGEIETAAYRTINNQDVTLFAVPSKVAHPFHHLVSHDSNCYIIVSAPEQSCEIRESLIVNVRRLSASNKRRLSGFSGKDSSKQTVLKNNRPISSKQAVYISSLYAQASRVDHVSLPGLWMLCEHKTSEVAFNKPTPVIKGLSVRCAPKHKNIVHSAIDYHGTVTTDLHSSLKSVGDIVSTFKEQYNVSCVDKQVFAEYGLGSGEEGRDHQITLEYIFSDPEEIRCPPPTSADTTVKMSLTPGGTLSPVLAVYQELSSLFSLLKISEGGSEWPESESPDGCTNPVSCDTFIEKVKEATFNYTTVMEDTIASPSIVNTIFPVRTDIDFCDMVWLFVKDSQCMDDLRKPLRQIAGAVFDHHIQPIIDTSNNAPLAKLFRKAVVCSNPEEQVLLRAHLKDLLSTERVIQSLVELGLGKLVKDYVNYFTIHELATKNQLSYFVQADSSVTIREQCNRLSKLHCVAELTSYILNQLPMAMPGQLTQSALQVYPSLPTTVENYDKEATPLFNIQLTAHPSATRSAVNLCASLQPLTWTLLLTEHNKEMPSDLWIISEQTLPPGDDTANTIDLDNILHVYHSHCGSAFL